MEPVAGSRRFTARNQDVGLWTVPDADDGAVFEGRGGVGCVRGLIKVGKGTCKKESR